MYVVLSHVQTIHESHNTLHRQGMESLKQMPSTVLFSTLWQLVEAIASLGHSKVRQVCITTDIGANIVNSVLLNNCSVLATGSI